MKTLITIAALGLLSVGAFAATTPSYDGQLTYTRITLTKDAHDANGLNYLGAPMKKWCNDFNSTLQFNSFAAAEYVEKLADGFYVCDGKFVTERFQSPVQIFEISCTASSPDNARKDCQ